ncbi:MAG: hypothetical protein AAB360_03485 [Patescibacteria group bacterium]
MMTALFVSLFILFWQGSLLLATIIGAPTVYAAPRAIRDSLRLASLKPDELLVDLGCGNARSLIIAAREFDARGLGIERSPYAYLIARINVLLWGQRKRIRIVFGDFKRLENELSRINVVYLYLINSTLAGAEKWFFEAIGTETRVVVLSFKFRKRQPIKTAETINLGRKTTIGLYRS